MERSSIYELEQNIKQLEAYVSSFSEKRKLRVMEQHVVADCALLRGSQPSSPTAAKPGGRADQVEGG
jgi:hypothetical protein